MRAIRHLDTRPAVTRTLTITAAALLLAACGTAGGTDDGPDPAGGNGDPDGDYVLERGIGPDGDVPLIPSSPVTLRIDGDQWSGTSACNSYSGQVEIDGNQVTTGAFAVTEMACSDPDVMASEQTYLAALLVIDRVSADGDTLVLTGPDTELVFARRAADPDAAPVGPRWVLTELLEGDGPDGAVSSVAAEADLVLSEDGRLAGSTGCNRMMGAFTLDGATLVVEGPLGTTRMACTDEAAAAQERHILAVLDAGPLALEVTGDRLTVTAADGRGLGYRAA
jgi:heat shock protein HslJ